MKRRKKILPPIRRVLFAAQCNVQKCDYMMAAAEGVSTLSGHQFSLWRVHRGCALPNHHHRGKLSDNRSSQLCPQAALQLASNSHMIIPPRFHQCLLPIKCCFPRRSFEDDEGNTDCLSLLNFIALSGFRLTLPVPFFWPSS